MNQIQSINQLVFLILGLILASLFVGTFRAGLDANGQATRGFWLMSLGTRAGAFFSWACIPVFGAVMTLAANSLFVFSAGCMAMMFRSWRMPVSRRAQLLLALFCIGVAALMEWLRQSGTSLPLRVMVLGVASLSMSAWELAELRKKIVDENELSLKLIAGVVLLQMALSSAAVIGSLQQVNQNVVYITDNDTPSMRLVWLTMTIHLVIYLFIAGYLFRRVLIREIAAIKQRNDVTLLLQERERLLASLIASNRVASTGALSATVAHEMSQPLTAAILKLGLLRRSIETDTIDKSRPLALLGEAVDDIGRSKDVLDHLRALFRQATPRLKLRNIHELVTQTIALVRGRLDSAQVELRYSSMPDASAPIVDREIQQVLINLINNAIDSLSSNDHAAKQIHVELSRTADVTRISVADNGAGIQPALVDTLFQLASSDKPNGMGIGLWISQHIIEDHHRGKLYIDRDHTPGARFVIELPNASPDAISDSAR